MIAKKLLLPALALPVVSMSLSSCSLLGAITRTTSQLLQQSSGDATREAMFDGLREIHAEYGIETVNPPAADSMQ